jgi:DNA polymerase-3 subunit gamma/tau
MSYVALYRKFRPAEFSEVKGQEHIVTTLQNQIKANRIGHAYLFCGTRGTGKTSIAKIFAKAVNCESPVDGSPCGNCATCKSIAAGTSMNVIEIDAASNNGVDNIREIRENVAYSPTEGKYKVYIIDEVHMLSIGAFNALLKTLEEPPEYVIFILATTEAHKIPITILSRCQRYDFKRITAETICARLTELMDKEAVDVEEKALRYIAKAADGSMRDALSLLDQCIAFYLGKKLTYDNVLEVLGALDTDVYSSLLRKIIKRDIPAVMSDVEDIVMQGRELSQFVTEFIQYLRNLLFVQSADHLEDFLEVSTENLAQLKEEAKMIDADALMRYIRVFSELSGQIKYSTQKRVLTEVALIKLCKPQMERSYDSLLERLSVIEDQLANGVVSAAPTGTEPEKKPVPVKEQPRVKACSDDIRRVIHEWNQIIKECSPVIKSYLIGHRDFRQDGNGGLQIVMRETLAADLLGSEDLRKELENVIYNRYGKEVSVQYISVEQDSSATANLIDVDYIQSVIHADILIEED